MIKNATINLHIYGKCPFVGGCMRKQPEITEATRNIFIEAFCELYRTRPIEKITVKELVEKAGYSRATFYNYFKDAYDLLEYVENEFITSLLNNITSNIEAQHSFDQFVHKFVMLVKSKETYINVFMNSANNSSFIEKLKDEAVPLLLSSFHVPTDNLSARYALEFYVSGLIPVIGTWLKNEQNIPIEELGKLVKGILQEGILKQVRN